MKFFGNYAVFLILLLCNVSTQAFADDAQAKRAAAMRSVDMKLYDFYMDHSLGLELCMETCPSKAKLIDDASGTLVALLDGAVSSIRGEHHGVMNFSEHTCELLSKNKKVYSKAAGCTPCLALAKRVQQYADNGLPAKISRVALLHTEKYKNNPELEFADNLIYKTHYGWIASGKRRSCNVQMPRTWAKAFPERSGRSFEYRSALGNGVPFFAIESSSARKVYSQEKVLQELHHRVQAEVLSKQFGLVEILAQGVQRLGATQGIWVMFAADGKGENDAGYYYNWYMLVDGTVLMFRSGVNGSGKSPTMEQEELFRKYYHTLREIAVSSVIR